MTAAIVPVSDLTEYVRSDVYKNGELAAHLERTPEGNVFGYTRDWVRNGGAPIATTLPVTSSPVVTTGGAVPAFFAGLLPEGRRLSALRRSVKTSADDEFSLVLAIGADAVGDVTVYPEGIEPSEVPARLSVSEFDSISFGDLADELDINIDRVGIPGVQDKVSLAMMNLPVTRAGQKYLLKLTPPEYPHLVENEAFFLRASQTSGNETVEAKVVSDAKGLSGLVVTRFDRASGPDGQRSFAVEDGCQVLNLHPEAKYRVRTETLLAQLCARCEAPLPAARTLLSQTVFAYLTCNGDAHAKNFSILQDQFGRWSPAPAYDLPSSQPYGDNTLALSVGGKRDGNIPGRVFVDLGMSLGLPERASQRAVVTVADRADIWLDGLADLPFDGERIARLRRTIRNRQRMLRLI